MSVTFFLSSSSSLSVSCQGKRKGCVSYPGKMWNTGEIVEFFSVFLRLMRCLSSQENTITVLYCVCMGYHSDLVWFRLVKGVPAHNSMDYRQRKPNEISTMTQNCANCQILLLLSSVLKNPAAIFSAPFCWIGRHASEGLFSLYWGKYIVYWECKMNNILSLPENSKAFMGCTY